MTLAQIIRDNATGRAVGLPSWCTAHPETLAAILHSYRLDTAPILIEATCNQVNQFGGYTGMTPADFAGFVQRTAVAQGVDPERLILGGDHLGPNPWKSEAAAQAMAKARDLVAGYVAAGFTKIHLDASMACGGETLTEAEMARRAADLCAVAEATAQGHALSYVIGTEVPVPGGETQHSSHLAVTSAQAARKTHDLHRLAFAARGLEAASDRVVGLVVQPGVDFGNEQIITYDRPLAAGLAALAHALNGPLFEAHSTDYQTQSALAALVQDHFAVLKVGPELTFAFRQAIIALERLEILMGLPPSRVTPALLAAMRDQPAYWRAYVETGPREESLMLYGLSDRLRYYWPTPAVQAAQSRLFAALRAAPEAPALLAQVTGSLVTAYDPATLPETVIRKMVGAVVHKYRSATGA
ncbi:MAG: class II D-tagatose-bisphosphate aldolase, non-catalytic subunit [Rhodobacteraceae bacterium]|nr:class II D-tagatose-bisphosphate aldolase, non-catalytic subunit [Paracoccaceae bacterium]MCF8521118.1 class II D-tagatose-bisphosphate aldolase, non-catalytic subunit [Paracoccaceae bacterium]